MSPDLTERAPNPPATMGKGARSDASAARADVLDGDVDVVRHERESRERPLAAARASTPPLNRTATSTTPPPPLEGRPHRGDERMKHRRADEERHDDCEHHSDSDVSTNFGDRVEGEGEGSPTREEHRSRDEDADCSDDDHRDDDERDSSRRRRRCRYEHDADADGEPRERYDPAADTHPGPPCALPLEYWTRSEECTERKRRHIAALDERGGYWGVEEHIENTVLRDADVALERNMFPYECPRGITHWTLWSRREMTEPEIVRWCKSWLAERRPRTIKWNYDLNENNSVDVPHYHVFIESPLGEETNDDEPPEEGEAVSNDGFEKAARDSLKRTAEMRDGDATKRKTRGEREETSPSKRARTTNERRDERTIDTTRRGDTMRVG